MTTINRRTFGVIIFWPSLQCCIAVWKYNYRFAACCRLIDFSNRLKWGACQQANWLNGNPFGFVQDCRFYSCLLVTIHTNIYCVAVNSRGQHSQSRRVVAYDDHACVVAGRRLIPVVVGKLGTAACWLLTTFGQQPAGWHNRYSCLLCWAVING